MKQIVKIELKNIDSFKDHPFKVQRDDSFNELKESIKENGLLEGAGAYLRLPGSEIKFSQKQFKQTLYTNPEFYNQFVNTCFQALTNDMLEREAKKKIEEQYGVGMVSPYQAILQQLNNSNI